MKKILVLSLILMSGCSNRVSFTQIPPNVPVPIPVVKADSFVIDDGVKIHSINSKEKESLLASKDISGLAMGEKILDIDIRPADGKVYGLSNMSKIYKIDPENGMAYLTSTLNITLDSNAKYSIDFNPVVDRLRVVGSNGQNLRINFLSGAVTTDGAVNGGGVSVIDSVAYTDTFSVAGRGTTLFTLSKNEGALYIQNPPNNGTQSMAVTLGEVVSEIAGFDIDVENKASVLWKSGNAWSINSFDPTSSSLKNKVFLSTQIVNPTGFALIQEANPTLVGLKSNNSIVQWRAKDPSLVSNSVAIFSASVMPLMGEKVIGIDYRVSDNRYYAVTSSSRLLSFAFPANGAVDVNPVLVGELLLSSNSTAYVQSGVDYSIDFNPTLSATVLNNRLRIIGSDGSNGAINVETLLVTAQGSIKPSGTVLAGLAYINNFSGTSATMLLSLNASTGELGRQIINPGMADDGTFVSLGALGFTPVQGKTGFDIVGTSNVGWVSTRDASDKDVQFSIDISNGASSEAKLIGDGSLGIVDLLQRF